MSDNETPPSPHGDAPEPEEPAPESVTKPKKKWEFTEARRLALEKAHAARAEKAAEKKRLKRETEKKALEIIEDRRMGSTAEDEKLDHVLYEIEKLKKHMTETRKERGRAPQVSASLTETESEYEIPKNLKPPPPARRSRKKAPPDTESELTESDYPTSATETVTKPRRAKREAPVERTEDYQPPPVNIMFG